MLERNKNNIVKYDTIFSISERSLFRMTMQWQKIWLKKQELRKLCKRGIIIIIIIIIIQKNIITFLKFNSQTRLEVDTQSQKMLTEL